MAKKKAAAADPEATADAPKEPKAAKAPKTPKAAKAPKTAKAPNAEKSPKVQETATVEKAAKPPKPSKADAAKKGAAKAEKKARKKAKRILAEQPPLVVSEIAERIPATIAAAAAARAGEPSSAGTRSSARQTTPDRETAPAETASAATVRAEASDATVRAEAPATTEDAASRPLVTVTSAVLSLVPEQGLSVVVVRAGDEAPWTLPAAPLAAGEEPAAAVSRTVPEQSGVVPSDPVQLQVLLDPDAGPHDWVLTVAHLVTVLHHRVPGQPAPARGPGSRTRRPVAPQGVEVALAPVAELSEESWALGASHRGVVERAVAALRSAYRTVPDPHGFLPGDVTLSELRAVHEAVGGEDLQPDTFRRAMLPRLTATGEKSGAGRGRPAALYRVQR